MSLLNLHIAAALVAVAQGGVAELAYDNHGIDLGESISQTVVHGRLTGGSADDLIVFTHDERARQMAVYAYDLDGDGRVDFGMLSFKLGIGKIISMLLTGSVSFNMNFYLMGQGGYSEEPNVQRRVKLRLDLGSGRVAGNWVSVGDFTGDGVKDLLVQAGATQVDIYPGTGDAGLFAKRPIEVAVDLSDQGSVRLADLNHDGKDDMFMAYRLPDEENLRVGIALSR